MRLRILFSILFFYCAEETLNAQYLTTPNGLNYFFWRQYSTARTPKPKPGDYVHAYILEKTETDTFINSWADGRPDGLFVEMPTYKGCINEALTLMGEGDSAQFRVVADSFYLHTKKEVMPDSIRKGSFITFIIKMHSFVRQEQIKAYYDNLKHIADSTYPRKVAEYLEKKHLDTLMTPSGLIYSFSQKNIKKRIAKIGDRVGVHWVGYLIDGTKFGSTVETYAPVNFIVGTDQVIAAWNEILPMMHERDIVRVIVPYHLGFGGVEYPFQFPVGSEVRKIPPYSILIYDIELLEILNK